MIDISKQAKFNIYYIILALYILGIFGISSIPPSKIPSVEFWLPIDKIVHFFEYGIFAFILTSMILRTRKKLLILTGLLVILISASLGAIDESYQLLTKRTSSISDWVADISGATVFMIATILCAKFRHSSKKR